MRIVASIALAAGLGASSVAAADALPAVGAPPAGRVAWTAEPVDNTGAYAIAPLAGAPTLLVGNNDSLFSTPDDLFVAALDDAGRVAWRVSGMAKWGRSIARAPGRLYFGSEWSGDLDFAGVRAGASASGAFVAALDDAGTLLWGRPLTSGSFTRLVAVAPTADGGVAAAIGLFAAAPRGPLAMPVRGGQDAVVVKYDASGELAFARSLGVAGYDEAVGIVPAPGGDLFVAGTRWRGTSGWAWDLAEGPSKAWLARLAPDGSPRFQVELGPGGTHVAFTRVVASGDGVVVVGTMRWRNRLGEIELDAGATDRAFLAGLDGAGHVRWARFHRAPRCLAVDEEGRLVMADLDGVTRETEGGEVTTILPLSREAVVAIHDCAVDGAGAIYLSGHARPRSRLGDATLPGPAYVRPRTAWHNPYSEGFVAKIVP
jgi:hypothetical protein